MISKATRPAPYVEQIYEVADIKTVLETRLKSRLDGTRDVHAFAFAHLPPSSNGSLRAATLHKEWCGSPNWMGDLKDPTTWMELFKQDQIPSAADLAREVGACVYKASCDDNYLAKMIAGLNSMQDRMEDEVSYKECLVSLGRLHHTGQTKVDFHWYVR